MDNPGPDHETSSRVASQENEAQDNSKRPAQRSHAYYFKDDPMAIFLVEDQLFKVHRHYFSEGSEVFRDMFSSPSENGTDPDGVCDEKPISLPGVTVKEFEAILDYFYSMPHARTRFENVQQNLELYLDLLNFSHRFLFDDIFQYGLRQLQPFIDQIPTTKRILLGDKYGLEEWLLSAYQSLLDRGTTLTMEEAMVLGYDRVVRFLGAKEEIHSEQLNISKLEGQQEARAELCNGYCARRGRHNGYNQCYDDSSPLPTRTPTQEIVKKHFSKT